MAPRALSPERAAARWWTQPDGREVRWQLQAESMRRDSTIAELSPRVMRRMPDLVVYAERNALSLRDVLAYSANAETGDGRLRLVALFPGHPYSRDPEVLCLDGPRLSKHRNPPFEDGVYGKSATLCLYYRRDPDERRWLPEQGLLGLFDIARLHVANEHEWRRTKKWPGSDAPHGPTAPAPQKPELAVEPISPRNMLLYAASTSRPTRAPRQEAA
jgi:hypothetical protein